MSQACEPQWAGPIPVPVWIEAGEQEEKALAWLFSGPLELKEPYWSNPMALECT